MSETMNQKTGTRNIVITGLLLALEIIFQILGNYFQIGLVNINLTLIAVVLAGVLCGPGSAMVLGFFNGVMALFSPSTMALFMPVSPHGTVITCFTKCTIAGFVSALVFKALKNKNRTLGLILASILVPILNTGIFCLGSLIFFKPLLKDMISEKLPNIGAVLILGFIGWNFIFELLSTAIISPIVGTILLKREEKPQND